MKLTVVFVGLASAVGVTFTVCQASADTFGAGANTFDIPFVVVGNPGNAADTTGAPNPAGSVPYAFRMGKFEISEQMIDKANALGGLGITKDTRGPDKPATAVSWNEAGRFVNWLNSNAGAPPAYKFAAQPGDVGYSANDNIQLWTPSDPGYDSTNLYRSRLATYFLPSINEWYKSAFYDPVSATYYDYPTGSDAPPTSIASGTAAGTAVFNVSDQIGPADITQAGGLSPYGTMAQGGNVHEWLESAFGIEPGYDREPSIDHALRGGFWGQFAIVLSSSYQFSERHERDIFGFRVAATDTPEPSALFLAAMAFARLIGRRTFRERRSRLRVERAQVLHGCRQLVS